jgi:ppGpp synthetase/RelA/SpoT-type nucleotidyltranferase
MDWHAELCSRVASEISDREWASYRGDFDVTARAKTIDTLRDKLIRQPNLHLNQVQDLAGVRIDLDCNLDQQTALAEEIKEFFGAARAEIKDIRLTPHSGYRAVHVWLRLPAGRVEIQIRTRGQSVWANTYERLGDYAGRHIRYGESHDDQEIQSLVEHLQSASEQLAALEDQVVRMVRIDARSREVVDVMARIRDDPSFSVMAITDEERDDLIHIVEDEPRRRSEREELMSDVRSLLQEVLDDMESIRRMLGEVDA